MPDIDQSFKNLMSEIPASVSIVTCIELNKLFGCTISSLVSLDIEVESAKILFVLKKASLVGAKIIKNKSFSVNVLTSIQKKYAEYYSGERKPDDIDDKKWHIENKKYAILKDSKVFFKCDLIEVIESYQANIFIGKVLDSKYASEEKSLVYCARKFSNIKD